MLAIAGRTAGPNGLNFFEGTQGYPGVNKGNKGNKIEFFLLFLLFHDQRRALQLVSNKYSLSV